MWCVFLSLTLSTYSVNTLNLITIYCYIAIYCYIEYNNCGACFRLFKLSSYSVNTLNLVTI